MSGYHSGTFGHGGLPVRHKRTRGIVGDFIVFVAGPAGAWALIETAGDEPPQLIKAEHYEIRRADKCESLAEEIA
jgi:hypothetical protein